MSVVTKDTDQREKDRRLARVWRHEVERDLIEKPDDRDLLAEEDLVERLLALLDDRPSP